MKKLIIIAVALGLLILDNTLLPYYAIKGAFPSLLFVFAISFSLINGREEAVFIGVVSGFLQDIFFFHGFGVNMLLNMLLCVLAAKVGEGIFKQNRIIPVITCFILSIFKVIGVLLLFKLFSQSIEIDTALISAALNTVVMILVYKLILRISEKYFTNETWRFK